MNQNKQIVTFLDFWGFKKYYELIKLQKKEDSQEYLFKTFTCLYHDFSKRLNESLIKIPNLIKETGNNTIFNFVKSTQILVISDSIIVSIDCNDDTIKAAYTFLCFLLMSAIRESTKIDGYKKDLEKFGTFLVLPIRGAVSYDYSITKLSEPNPYIFSNAYNNAIALEKEARWPRILIANDLYSHITGSDIANSSITEQGRYSYFDYLKFNKNVFISNPKVNFKKREDRLFLIKSILKSYKDQIYLATKEASIIFANKENSPIDPFKYKEWIDYYNSRIKYLIETDVDLKNNLDLMLPTHFYQHTFNFKVRNKSGFYTICILPWIHLEKDYEVNNTRLLRYPEHKFDKDFKLAVREILKSYMELDGTQIKECTIIIVKNKNPRWHLNKDNNDLEKVQCDLALYFLSLFSCNNYFSQHSIYINSTVLQPVFQNLTIPPTGKAVQHRRRDGSSIDGGYRHGDLKYSRPLECKSLRPKMDPEFLKSLSKLAIENNDFYRRVLGAISFVQLANTDQPQMFIESEAILLASAFEQLYNTEDKRELTCAYHNCFKTYEMKKVQDVLSVRSRIKLNTGKYANFDLKWQLGQKWIEELYDLRSAVVHGENLSKRTWGWSPFEHLVIGSFVFPLAVKILLNKLGNYKLTDHDEELCRSIDLLLATNDWQDLANKRSNHTIWQEQISKAGSHLRAQKLAKALSSLKSSK